MGRVNSLPYFFYNEVRYVNLTQLIAKTRAYARDNNSFMFKDSLIKDFINEGIDRLAQYKVFENMPYLDKGEDIVSYLPRPYHYLLALFASARCYDTDERFYEGTEKRNEFEYYFDNLIADIEMGNVVIKDKDGKEVLNTTTCTDVVTDDYFNVVVGDIDDGVDGIV